MPRDEDNLRRIYPGYPDKRVSRAVLVTDQNGRNIAQEDQYPVMLDDRRNTSASAPRPSGRPSGFSIRNPYKRSAASLQAGVATATGQPQVGSAPVEPPQASRLPIGNQAMMRDMLRMYERAQRAKTQRDAVVQAQSAAATAGPVTDLPAAPSMAANPTAQQMKDAKLRAAGLSEKDIADMQAMREDARRVVMRIDSEIRQARMDGNEARARDLEFDLRAARKKFIDMDNVLTGRGRDLTPAQREMRARDLQTQYASNRRIMLERMTDEYKQALDSGDKRRAAIIKDDIDRIAAAPDELNVPVDMSPADTFDENTESGSNLREMISALRERNRLIDRDKQISREGEQFEDLNRQAMLGDAQSNLDRIALDQAMMREQLAAVKDGSSIEARKRKADIKDAESDLRQRGLESKKQDNPLYAASIGDMSQALKRAHEVSQGGADFSTPVGRKVLKQLKDAFNKYNRITDRELRSEAAREILSALEGIGANEMELYSDNAIVGSLQRGFDILTQGINPRRYFEGRGPIAAYDTNQEAQTLFNSIIKILREQTELPR